MKINNYRSLIKTISLALIPLLLFWLTAGLPAKLFAQDESPSETKNLIDKDIVRESLKKRLEKSVDEEGKETPKNPVELYAYFGKITNNDQENSQFIVKSDFSGEHQIKYSDQTALVLTPKKGSSKKIKAVDIEENWFALAMGSIDNDKKMQALRVVFYQENPLERPKRKIIFGKISEFDKKTINLKNGQVAQFDLDKKILVSISGLKKATLEDINVDDKAVAIARDLDEDQPRITAIFVWPGTSSPEAEENQVNATPSAEATASGKNSQ